MLKAINYAAKSPTLQMPPKGDLAILNGSCKVTLRAATRSTFHRMLFSFYPFQLNTFVIQENH